MADTEQLAILGRGVEAWNSWRTHNPDVFIDLGSANLNSFNLEWINLADADLEGADLSCACMNHAILVRAKLSRANLAHASLDHANMAHAHLERANLAFASLEEAMLPFAHLVGTNLGAANLKNLRAEDAHFKEANLSYANLERAVLSCSDFRHANLLGANLEGVNMTAINLENANISLIQVDRVFFWKILWETRCHPRLLWERRLDLVLGTTVRCKGINAAAAFGSQRFKLFLQDQDYLEELMEADSGRFWCYLWWLSSDCGRSLLRWANWSILFAFLYSLIYYHLGRSHFYVANMRTSYVTALYYSIVTFTTLGFGDIAPTTNIAAMIVCSEVILGYLMLGGLISIFAAKLSRRSG
jgi:uncharacterized protein YjbI with pentapeptide repeats